MAIIKRSVVCGSCKNGEWDDDDPDVGPEDAEYYVTGKIPADTKSGWRPYRAYLCRDHMEMLEEDGAVWKTVRKL